MSADHLCKWTQNWWRDDDDDKRASVTLSKPTESNSTLSTSVMSNSTLSRVCTGLNDTHYEPNMSDQLC